MTGADSGTDPALRESSTKPNTAPRFVDGSPGRVSEWDSRGWQGSMMIKAEPVAPAQEAEQTRGSE